MLGLFEQSKAKGKTYSISQIIAKISEVPQNAVFYGAGHNMKNILEIYEQAKIGFCHEIWDKDADRIGKIKGYKVDRPDYTEISKNSRQMIITIGSKAIARDVERVFSDLGWSCIDGAARILSQERKSISFPVEFDEWDKELIDMVLQRELTMVSPERSFATLSACKYAVLANIDGDFVECGVWRGGNALIAAAVFKRYKSNRKVWLFDTFEGFTNLSLNKTDARTLTGERLTEEIVTFYNKKLYDPNSCGNSLDDVKQTFAENDLFDESIQFIKGDVMETLHGQKIPKSISVLRLDTDLYESTKKEMDVLYPRLSKGGVLIVDDYGHVDGARTAVDEYFQGIKEHPLMHYIDYTGRMIIKQST